MTVSTTLTYLFTDIEGSTSQWETRPDMPERVEQHFAILRECVSAAGGEVFATMGDGIGAAFSSARSAASAAVEAQRRLPATGLRSRIGLHTGEARRVGDDYRGRALNRAARIMAVAHGGQIVLSDVTAKLIRTGPVPIDLVDLGTHELRDLCESEHLWQVAHPDLTIDFPAIRSSRPPSRALPRHRTSFVGRDRDVCEIVSLLRTHPIVTLTGTGGVGKTRLAVRAAAEASEIGRVGNGFDDSFVDVWFVDLASITDPTRVAETVARAAGLDGAMRSPRDVAATVGQRRALAVLDNCEHVVEAACEVVDALATECPNLSVLATSREPLLVAGEYIVNVPTLDPASDGVDLFEQRAAASGVHLDPAHATTITRICERLGGLPLAIELAAARVPMFGLHGVEALLDRPFEVLVTRSRRGDERHRTMHATIDWSYRLLERDERWLLERLAVFRGGFDLDAALHIASLRSGTTIAGAELVDSLVRKSLIGIDDRSRGERYRMSESIRAFAIEELTVSGEFDAAHELHAEWMAALLDTSFDDPCSAAVEQRAIRLERELDNWTLALATATRLRSSSLAERLCSPPTAYFALGRHDLTDLLTSLYDACVDRVARRAIACTLACASTGAPDPALLPHWNAEMRRLEGANRSGAGHLIEWIVLTWEGRRDDSVQWCLASADDERFTFDTRNLFTGIATLDRFSLTDSTDDADTLVARSLEIIERSPVASHRVTSRLGAAWALMTTETNLAMQLAQEAIAEISELPTYLRLILRGNVARWMASVDPALAAAYVLDRLDQGPADYSYIDLIPLVYAGLLLEHVGHPAAGPTLATLATSPAGPYLSMLGLGSRARVALAEHPPLAPGELFDVVRDALRSQAGDQLSLTVGSIA